MKQVRHNLMIAKKKLERKIFLSEMSMNTWKKEK